MPLDSSTRVTFPATMYDQDLLAAFYDVKWAFVAFSNKIINDKDQADILVMDVVEKCLVENPTFDSWPLYRSWMFTAIKNASINYLARQKHKGRYLGQCEKTPTVEIISVSEENARLINERMKLVNDQVDLFSPKAKILFKRVMLLEHGEIASVAVELGIKYQVVLNKKYLSIKKLKKIFSNKTK